jgi:hypothetical protein
MSILKKSLLAIALIAPATLPAAAEGIIDGTYNKEQMERYMPNARATAPRTENRARDVAPQFFLQDRRGAPYAAPASSDVPAGG